MGEKQAGIIKLTISNGSPWHVSGESISEAYPTDHTKPLGTATIVLKWANGGDGEQCLLQVKEDAATVVKLWSRALGTEVLEADDD